MKHRDLSGYMTVRERITCHQNGPLIQIMEGIRVQKQQIQQEDNNSDQISPISLGFHLHPASIHVTLKIAKFTPNQ